MALHKKDKVSDRKPVQPRERKIRRSAVKISRKRR